jgi:hypothetical protein
MPEKCHSVASQNTLSAPQRAYREHNRKALNDYFVCDIIIWFSLKNNPRIIKKTFFFIKII